MKQIPELAVLTRDERQIVRRAAFAMLCETRPWFPWLIRGGMAVVILTSVLFGLWTTTHFGGEQAKLIGGLIAGVSAVLGTLTIYFLVTKQLRPFILDYMQRRGKE